VCALPPKSQNGGLKNRHRHRCRHQEKWENATLAGVGKAAAGKAAAAAKQKAANEISGLRIIIISRGYFKKDTFKYII